MGLTFKLKKNVFNLCCEAQGEIRNGFNSHLKRRKNGLGKDMHYSCEDEKLPSLMLIISFADHWEKGKVNIFFFLQAAFIFLLHFLFVQFKLLFPLFFFFLVLCLFVCFYFSSSLHMGSENSEERQATSLGFLGQRPLQSSHLPSL